MRKSLRLTAVILGAIAFWLFWVFLYFYPVLKQDACTPYTHLPNQAIRCDVLPSPPTHGQPPVAYTDLSNCYQYTSVLYSESCQRDLNLPQIIFFHYFPQAAQTWEQQQKAQADALIAISHLREIQVAFSDSSLSATLSSVVNHSASQSSYFYQVSNGSQVEINGVNGHIISTIAPE